MAMAKEERPWLKQPGEVVDMHGVPIYPGDLIRTFHFRGRRRKRFYMYHTAVMRDGGLWLVPTCHLEPSKVKGGGAALLSDDCLDSQREVISGYGPEGCIDYTDRPKRTPPKNLRPRWAISGERI